MGSATSKSGHSACLSACLLGCLPACMLRREITKRGHQTAAPEIQVEVTSDALDTAIETIVCIGDVHGHAKLLKRLWTKLENEMGRDRLKDATVVFLGDLNDRGPNTKGTLAFVARLVRTRPQGKTIVLAGNHDFGMASFLGCPPADKLPADLETTLPTKFKRKNKDEVISSYWDHVVPGEMHYGGKRWAGADNVMQASKTVKSFGCEWEDSLTMHAALQQAVPPEQKALLRDMRLVCDLRVSWAPFRVVCVHAGLLPSRPAEAQIHALKERDLTNPILFGDDDDALHQVLALSKKWEVEEMHPDLEGNALLISGHHGFCMEDTHSGRIIFDKSGGHPSKKKPLQAMILSSEGRRVISCASPDD